MKEEIPNVLNYLPKLRHDKFVNLRLFRMTLIVLVLIPASLSWQTISCDEHDEMDIMELVPPELRKGVARSLEAAGENAGEIEMAIRNLDGDERRAVCFLAAQLSYRCAVLPEGDGAVAKTDAQSVTEKLLTSHVKISFWARKKYPWAKLLREEAFFRYVLAYRGQTERLEDWRKTFWENQELRGIADAYADKFESAEGKEKSAVFRQMIHAFNEWLAGKVTYAPRGLPDLAPSELLEAGTGRCTDLTNAYLAILRTFGIAATGVRVIWWPKENGNHYWARVLDPVSEDWYDIDGGLKGELKDEYFRAYRFRQERPIAKAYIVVPGEEDGQISGFLRKHRDTLPLYINYYLVAQPVVDITLEFTDVSRVVLEDLQAGEIAYLSVFNHSQWREVAASLVSEDGKAVFENIGAYDVLYLPVYFKKEAEERIQIPAGDPFVLRADGVIERFVTELSRGAVLDKEVIIGKTDGKQCLLLKYWDGRQWKEIERIWSDSEGQILLKQPVAGILYVLWNEKDNNALRPFSVRMKEGNVVLEQY